MLFRPCIDIHNGKVKQIIGGSLRDKDDRAVDNYVSEKGAEWYAGLYRDNNLPGGHIILLNPAQSEYYDRDVKQAERALKAYPGGMMIGGGMNDRNAARFIEMGASHVIVTSFVFKNGRINYDNLEKLSSSVGRNHLVLDLSCRIKDGRHMIVTDRWQKYTDTELNEDTLDTLAPYCSEFLVHAADVEGKVSGIDEDLARMLGTWDRLPVTYAGGISSLDDIRLIMRFGNGNLNFTIGSALDLFGGSIPFKEVIRLVQENNRG